MIASIHNGSGFRGALEYNFDKSKDAEIVGGNMVGSNPRELAREFGETRRLREDIEKPVYHVSLSLKPGETLRNDQWGEAAGRYMAGMGFEKSQYIALRHKDKDHEHVHIVASRIDYQGKVVDTSKDYYRSQEQVRELERIYQLERVPSSHETDRKQYSRGELEQLKESGEPSVKARLFESIDRASRGKPTMSEFVERLEKEGVRTVPNYQSSGRLNGVSYELDGARMKGSDLGKAYTVKGLQDRRGVEYLPERDDARLRQAGDPSSVRTDGPQSIERERTANNREGPHGGSSANERVDEAPERDKGERIPAAVGLQKEVHPESQQAEAVRELERLYNLAPGPASSEAHSKQGSPGELEQVQGTREVSVEARLVDSIDRACVGKPSMSELVERLEKRVFGHCRIASQAAG